MTNPKPTCRVVGAGVRFTGKQALTYTPGISAESVGATGIHLQLVTLPPGVRAKAHRHESHETAIHVLSGESGMWYGDRLEQHLTARAGDFVYIPAGMPHLPYNPSATEACVAVIARTDPNEQESVILMPELDGLHA
ncbi:cupin domain-containing protein [Inquilinus sp. Marseille-Q2685]|uniref:cupin domain-containing protein n=1 Tax=Inquilinus sp. Marseille-Q2685 TaxID=2866581 RepID=UPI001CE45F58|nr:cupin domain-containing protein [Inquilinus sp. Marseille-Q2685]